jgi:DNA-binding transcriptional MerR regulator
MPTRRTYQVKQVARLTGLTIRTLHHYDAIGLLAPSARSAAGYRLYDDDDLLRLQQILIGRELGLSLEAIRRSLDDPRFDRRQALLEQRTELEARTARTTAMIRAIDAALTAIEENDMSKVDLKKIFDGFDPEQYADEAQERWGHTDAYRISAERTKAYSAADWQRFKEEQGAIYADALAARAAGVRPDEPRAMDIAERHRLSFDRWFYPCSAQMHSGLADMWEADRRYADNIDKYGGGAGLTEYLAAAVRANAKRSPT